MSPLRRARCFFLMCALASRMAVSVLVRVYTSDSFRCLFPLHTLLASINHGLGAKGPLHVNSIIDKYRLAGASPATLASLASSFNNIHMNTSERVDHLQPSPACAWVRMQYHPLWAKCIAKIISNLCVPGYRIGIAWTNVDGSVVSRISALNRCKILDECAN